MKKLNCIFLATPGIASDALESLCNNSNINLELVVSMPDRPAGRGKELRSPEIITKAKSLNIETLQTDNVNKSEEFWSWAQSKDIDMIIVFAFAQFLGSKVLSLPKLGCFNIHTSLLPKYRGAAPMQYALFNGDKTTGVCIQRMVKKMDAGNIVAQKEVALLDSDNLGTLHDKFKALAPSLLNDFISDLVDGSINEVEQDESKVSFAPSIPKSETLLNFKESTNIELFNKIRGISPMPGAYCFINGKKLKVFESERSDINLKPSELSTRFNTLLIGTKSGSLRLSQVQLEGRSRGNDLEIINGFKNSKKEINISSSKDNK